MDAETFTAGVKSKGKKASLCQRQNEGGGGGGWAQRWLQNCRSSGFSALAWILLAPLGADRKPSVQQRAPNAIVSEAGEGPPGKVLEKSDVHPKFFTRLLFCSLIVDSLNCAFWFQTGSRICREKARRSSADTWAEVVTVVTDASTGSPSARLLQVRTGGDNSVWMCTVGHAPQLRCCRRQRWRRRRADGRPRVSGGSWKGGAVLGVNVPWVLEHRNVHALKKALIWRFVSLDAK